MHCLARLAWAVVLCWLVWPGIAGAQDWLRIDRPDPALRAQLPAEALDYGRFIWVPADSLAPDAQVGRYTHSRPSPFAVPVDGRPVDLAGAPGLDRPRPGRDSTELPDFHLIQFLGPTKPGWLDDLRRRGLQPVQAVAPFGYLVWGQAADLPPAAAGNEHPVRFSGELPAATRQLAPGLARGERHPYSRALIHGPDSERILDELRQAGAGIGPIRWVGGSLKAVNLSATPELFPQLLTIRGVLSVQQISQDAGPRGEMSNQSVLGLQATDQTLVPGYQDWLDQVGLDGSGVVVAVVDGGIRQTHQDLAGQFVDCIPGDNQPSSCSSGNDNHGTHVAGAIAGTAASGVQSNGFLRGQGVAPGAQLIEQRYPPLLGAGPGGMLSGGMLTIFAESALSGAVLANNSWGPSATPQGYDIPSREVDLITRNALPGADPAIPILPIWSVMNGRGDSNGACAPSSLGAPDEAKNLLAVGSSNLQNDNGSQRNNLFSLSANSAHGPACDGRIVPQLIAPGCTTDSTIATSDQAYSSNFCGTSMASPIVTGSAALFVQQQRLALERDPSPALIRARLTALARNLVSHFDADGQELGHRPDRKQGWGRLDLDAVINPPQPVFMLDQTRVFRSTGQAWTGRFDPVDPEASMHIMLAWTDAPGLGLGGAMPAWVNDLDLMVSRGQDVYYGNAFGADGYSTTAGGPDFRNNLEGVVLGAHQHGGQAVRVEVLAANLAADAIDPWNPGAQAQDFALVCINCEPAPDFTLDINPQSIRACLGNDDLSSQVTVRSVLGFNDEVRLGAQWLDAANGSLTLDTEASAPSFSRMLAIDPKAGGRHRVLIEAESDGVGSMTTLLELDLDEALVDAPEALAPVGNEPVSPATSFAWTELPGATHYRFELATDSAFTDPIENRVLDSTSWQPSRWLEPGQRYFWRVRGINLCGEGESSATFTLQVGLGPASALRFRNVPEPDGQGGFVNPVMVEIIDAAGNVIETDQTSRIALLLDEAPAEAVLSGTLERTVNNGVAVFDDLSINADNGGQFRLLARMEANEALPIQSFNLSAQQTVQREMPGGLQTSGPVQGVGFSGTVSGISGSLTWASDLRLVLSTPDSRQFSLGGSDTSSEVEWEFQGEESTTDGTYTSAHPELFIDRGGLVPDEGFWRFEFTNDFFAGETMRWSDVEVILIKQPLETTSELIPLRGDNIFRDRFETEE